MLGTSSHYVLGKKQTKAGFIIIGCEVLQMNGASKDLQKFLSLFSENGVVYSNTLTCSENLSCCQEPLHLITSMIQQ